MKKILILFTSLLLVVTCAVTNVKPIHADDPVYSDWTSTNSLPISTPGYYCLTNDVTMKWRPEFKVEGDFYIDLNGHNIKLYNTENNGQQLIYVTGSKTNVHILNSDKTNKSLLQTNQKGAELVKVTVGTLSLDNIEISGLKDNTKSVIDAGQGVSLTVTNCDIKNNEISAHILNAGNNTKGANIYFEGCNIIGNKCTGGIIFNTWGSSQTTVSIKDTLVDNNECNNVLTSKYSVTIEGSIVSNNTAIIDGTININGGTLTVKDTSITNNTAPQAIKTGDSAQTYIKGSTVISGNKNSSNAAKNLYAKKSATNIHYDDLTNGASIYIDHPDTASNYVNVGVSNMNTDKQLAFNYIHATGDDTFYGFNDKGNVQLRFVNCSGISLNKANIKFDTLDDDPVQLEVTYNPTNTHDKSITWTSSDEEVATVVDGLVTPIGFGTATITAKQNSQSKSATCTVTISEPVPSHDHENGDVYEIPWGNVEGEWTKLPTTAGSYYLTHDITVEAPQGLSKNISICMNGHSIINANASEDNTGDVRRIMRIGGGATVTFDNCQSGGVITHDQQSLKGNASNGIFVGDTGSKLVLKNVTLTQIKANYPLSIGAGNTLEINGATITGNDGLITVMNSGHVDFIDGEISNNHAVNSGAAIRIAAGASCDMSGGLITGNISDGGAAGIYVCDTDGSKAAGVLNVSGGTITGNGSVERSTGGIGNCGTLTITGDVKVFDNYGKDESKHKNIFLEKGTAAFNSLGTEANLCVGFENGSPATIATDSEDNVAYVHLDNDSYEMYYDNGKILFKQDVVVKEDVQVNTDLNNDGTINMNFSTKISPEVEVDYEAAYVEVNGVQTALSDLSYTTNPDGSRQYVTPAPVMNPKQMTDKISMVIHNGDDSVISEPVELTVQDYLGVLAKDEGPYQNFAKAMLNYGSYTQQYFGYNTTDLANSILDELDRSVADVVADSQDADETVGETEGASIYGTSLNLKSSTEYNVYFELAGDVEEYSATLDGKDVDFIKSTTQPGKYYVKIQGVAAPNLSDKHVIVVKHNGYGNLTFTGSVLSYAYKVIENYSDTKTDLANCMRAMYKYFGEAKELSIN